MRRRGSMAMAIVALMLTAGAAPSPAPEKKPAVVTNPDWVKLPSSNDMMVVFPTKAAKTGAGGKATITCEVSTEGLLRKCIVVSETPPGLGFGDAAIALAGQFRMKPQTVNGVAVTSTVMIPINWPETPVGGVDNKVLSKPHWLATPTRADVRAAYPKGAKDSGNVLLVCNVNDAGEPFGCGTQHAGAFGGPARALSHKFRVDLTGVDQKTRNHLLVQFVIHFDAPGAAESGDVAGANVLTKPEWTNLPDVENFEALYPAQAKAKGVKTGVGKVDCLVAPGGALADCKLVSENPPGLGFGGAALKLAAGFALNPWTVDGRPVDGARVIIPIRLTYPDKPAEPTPPVADVKAKP